jgi:hypothetical protein
MPSIGAAGAMGGAALLGAEPMWEELATQILSHGPTSYAAGLGATAAGIAGVKGLRALRDNPITLDRMAAMRTGETPQYGINRWPIARYFTQRPTMGYTTQGGVPLYNRMSPEEAEQRQAERQELEQTSGVVRK